MGIRCETRNPRKQTPHSRFVLSNLQETGRLQFFYHSPSSPLPIRDVLGEQTDPKTEPYLERSAENYCRKCYQRNVLNFLQRPEKYLFLFTTCKGKHPELEPFRDKRFIVGYLIKKRPIDRGGRYAVQGPIKLYSFHDAYPLKNLSDNHRRIRRMNMDGNQTAKILNHFESRKNIFTECLQAVRTLKRQKKVRPR